MKRYSIITAIVAAATVLTDNTGYAFTPATCTQLSSYICRSSSPSTQLHSSSSYDKDRIKKAGGGITTLTPGDLCLYDPNSDGKLQGTNDLMDRIERGASFSANEATGASPAPPTSSTTQAPVETKPKGNIFTTNLTKLLNGGIGIDAKAKGGRNNSQY